MSDDLERRLRAFPSEFPRPDEHVTRCVADQVRGALDQRRQRSHLALGSALLAALAVGAVLGSVAIPASAVGVTMRVRPSVVRYLDKPDIFGAVTTGKAGEQVTVQFKQCGLYPMQFRGFMTTTTVDGGAWSLGELLYVRLRIPASGTFRAVWGNDVSRETRLKVRAFVDLRRLPGGAFYVRVAGTQSFWRKRVRVERFDVRLRDWILVRSLLLTESEGPGDFGAQVVTTKPFRPEVRKGTLVRAVLPRATARPCYLAGYSLLHRA